MSTRIEYAAVRPGMTVTTETASGRDETSGLEYYEARGTAGPAEWSLSAVESDSATLDITASVSSVEELDALIESMKALRTHMQRAETIRGEM